MNHKNTCRPYNPSLRQQSMPPVTYSVLYNKYTLSSANLDHTFCSNDYHFDTDPELVISY